MINWILVLNFKKLKLMKTKVIMAMLLMLIMVACKKNLIKEENLVGSWKLIETISGTGNGGTQRSKVEYESILTFKSDLTYFESNPFSNCYQFKYSIKDSNLTFNRHCSINENGQQIDRITSYTVTIERLDKRKLKINYGFANGTDEGLWEVYKKVKNSRSR